MTKKEYDASRYIKNRSKLLNQSLTWQKNNRVAANLKSKRSRDTSPDKERNRRLKYRFGITLEDYNRMFKNQNGCCAICGIHQSKLKRNLAVDHDKVTKLVRGLLCFDCNTGIGKMKHSIDFLNKSITYLKGDSQ